MPLTKGEEHKCSCGKPAGHDIKGRLVAKGDFAGYKDVEFYETYDKPVPTTPSPEHEHKFDPDEHYVCKVCGEEDAHPVKPQEVSFFDKFQDNPEYQKLLKKERKALDKELAMSHGFVALPDSLDEMVRDFTSIAPRSKSEVRRRISDLLVEEKRKERAKYMEAMKYHFGDDGSAEAILNDQPTHNI